MTKPAVKVTKLTDLIPDDRNANKGTLRGEAMIEDSLRKFGAGRSILVDRNNRIIAGNKTQQNAVDIGLEEAIIVPTDGKQLVVVQRVDIDLDSPAGREMALLDNRSNEVSLEWDATALQELLNDGLDLSKLWDDDELAALLADVSDEPPGDKPTVEQAHKTLAERFIVPPFSVLDARQGYWQERKRAWIALGIQSEIGRGNHNLGMSHPETTSTIDFYSQKRQLEADLVRELSKDECAAILRNRGALSDNRKTNAERAQVLRTFGEQDIKTDTWLSSDKASTSIFDPVLCELAYRWFCPNLASVLDPFAGGSVRGIVATYLGYSYTGVDLRPEQIAANVGQAKAIVKSNAPRWIVGDSRNLKTIAAGDYDFIFSCPPYFDLEIYSADKSDLSNADDYERFLESYRLIIRQAVDMLKDNRFACFVVGDIRDKQGFYRNFVADTIEAFQSAGATLYNEAILVTAVGSLPIRIRKQFESGRKLGKTHQNVLVFYKGDPKAIKSFGEIAVDWNAVEGLSPVKAEA